MLLASGLSGEARHAASSKSSSSNLMFFVFPFEGSVIFSDEGKLA